MLRLARAVEGLLLSGRLPFTDLPGCESITGSWSKLTKNTRPVQVRRQLLGCGLSETDSPISKRVDFGTGAGEEDQGTFPVTAFSNRNGRILSADYPFSEPYSLINQQAYG